jgi:hypothetical protein
MQSTLVPPVSRRVSAAPIQRPHNPHPRTASLPLHSSEVLVGQACIACRTPRDPQASDARSTDPQIGLTLPTRSHLRFLLQYPLPYVNLLPFPYNRIEAHGTMKRGIPTTAPGRLTPGPSPSSASPITPLPTHTRAIPNRPWRRQSCLRVRRTPCVVPAHNRLLSTTPRPTHHHAISNRHVVRLEIVATPTESTTSLFLIDPRQPHFPPAFSLSSSVPPQPRPLFPVARGTFPSAPAYLPTTRPNPSGGI